MDQKHIHAVRELVAAVEEFRAMPCRSLEDRMFQTLDRYRSRLKEIALHASEPPSQSFGYAGVTVWVGAATVTRAVSSQVFNAARGQVDPLKYEFEACRTAVMPQVTKGEGNE